MGVTKIATDAVEERIAKKKKKQAEAEGKITPKKGSIATRTTVSATDIRQAVDSLELDKLQRRIDNMPDGNIKKSMELLLKSRRRTLERRQADEVDTMSRKQQQSARDRKMKKEMKPLPMPFNKGGMPSRKGNFDMRKGGMFSK